MEIIKFSCPQCGHELRATADKAGKKARCTKCTQIVTIPAAAPAGAIKPTAAPATTEPSPPPPPLPAKSSMSFDDEDDGKAYALVDAPPPVEEEKKPKKRRDDDEDEDEEDEEVKEEEEFDETGRRILKKKKKDKERPKIKIKRRNLAALRKAPTHPEKWNMVRRGLLVVAISVMVWLTALLLRCLVLIIGASGPSEYAYLASTELVDVTIDPTPGVFPELHRTPFLVGLIGGSEFFTSCLWMMRIACLLTLVQLLISLAGYGFCLPVPSRYGMKGILIALHVLTFFNFILVLVLKFLPLTGAIEYTLIPYVLPEVAMLDANIDRLDAIHNMWSAAPFWENLFAIFLHMMILAEPVMFCVFLRFAGMSLKDDLLEKNAHGLIQLGLGCAFMVLAFQLLIHAGTTEVMLMVLRAVYILFLCFFAGQLIWYTIFLFQARTRIEKALKA